MSVPVPAMMVWSSEPTVKVSLPVVPYAVMPNPLPRLRLLVPAVSLTVRLSSALERLTVPAEVICSVVMAGL